MNLDGSACNPVNDQYSADDGGLTGKGKIEVRL
jgi:hypothetical protein